MWGSAGPPCYRVSMDSTAPQKTAKMSPSCQVFWGGLGWREGFQLPATLGLSPLCAARQALSACSQASFHWPEESSRDNLKFS